MTKYATFASRNSVITIAVPTASDTGTSRRGFFTSPAVKVMLFHASAAKSAPKGRQVDATALDVDRDLGDSLDAAIADANGGGRPLYALPTYTALLELRELLAERGDAQEYWR